MRFAIGMRWWLGLAFALVVAVTAVAVFEVSSRGSEDALRERAQDLAAGRAFGAAIEITEVGGGANLQEGVRRVAAERALAVFAFNRDGELLSAPASRSVELASIDDRRQAVATALAGRRFVRTSDEATIVGLPLSSRGAAALLVYAPHPDVAREIGLVRDELVRAALIAIAVGGLAGFLIASLIAARLRRIAGTAAAIEAGSFDMELRPRFRDELGDLAATIDRMRRRLRDSFARLESDRNRLEKLLERLHQGVVTVDRGLRVEFVNRAARRLLESETLAEGDPLPEPWEGVSLRRLVKRLIEADASVAEVRISPAENRTYSVIGVPVRGEDASAILVVTDVTEAERRERAEREFVQNAAHELRTPLTTIRAAVEALQRGAKDLPHERDRFLDHIDRESDRLVRLIRTLLMLARAQTQQERPPLERVELRPLLEDIAGRTQAARDVTVSVDCPAGLAAAADAELAGDALANLAANSAKYTERGEIVFCAYPADNGTVAIEVRDTGPGIEDCDLDRIYDRFYRRSDGNSGFGLGLAIARQVAVALGGAIEVETEPGVGTTAKLLLRRHREPAR